MAVIRKKRDRSVPSISTASLPDVIFMILFFFMVSTTMRTSEERVMINPPEASEAQKLEKKSVVSYILVGQPAGALSETYGTAPRIQLNNSFRNVEDVGPFVASEREKLNENQRSSFNVCIKADRGMRMGLISDIKQELRRANALTITYATEESHR